MSEIKHSEKASRLLHEAYLCCMRYRHEFIMPEHLLSVMLDLEDFRNVLEFYCVPQEMAERLESFLDGIEKVPEEVECVPEVSAQLTEVVELALQHVAFSGADKLDISHLVKALMELEDSWAAFMLRTAIQDNEGEFMSHIISSCEHSAGEPEKVKGGDPAWKKLVTCMNDLCGNRNPLVGREKELERTIQVLCRKEKNNPLHVGEPGVGKTALVWGLVRLIEEGKVPARLKGSRVYQFDLGSLLAGTQYRGDFENRIKQIMDGIESEGGNNVVYIDEIHALVGAGAVGDSAMDASNMLKPYLESGNIRFIGSTTYEEYNRHFSRSKGMIRRFQQIDIAEPTVEEAIGIIRQLKPHYEEYHGVRYGDDAVTFAVEASARHISDRFLPDKAIDLIDEAGAAMELRKRKATIGRREIATVLSKTCKVDALSDADEHDYAMLEKLTERMCSQIYGQDSAVKQVVEAVQMARAGLLDDNKPLASLLFVGPTGVGKTEIARVLSKELGIGLVRFDMSEYAEKHAVAKLIGSPAGYVGYEDGGLLTDAVRKSPNCVLLLDEIEKAHADIYNILLQVMDYARLTDNKGRHADFSNVILIMTSNAGAQFASQPSVGFASSVARGDAMMKQVKRIFKPEFLNRLSGTLVFRDMDREMATLILQKKLRELEVKLSAKKVKMKLDDAAFDYLLNEGFTVEYGAREMDRVIAQRLKPLLMREILFGKLKNGGKIKVKIKDADLSIG